MIFDGYLICTDCDGTLTDSKGELSAENAAAIRYFQENGGRFTLATGRFVAHLENFADQMKINAPLVSLNGTLLYDTEKKIALEEWKMGKQESEEVIAYLTEHYPQIWEIWMNCDLAIESVGFKPTEKHWQEVTADCPPMWYKLVMMQEAELTPVIQADLRARYGERFRFDSSWPNGLEMQRADSGKGIAIRRMKELYQGAVHTVICVGDAENDINMLECADISYAVANASEQIRSMTDRMTVSNDEHAIARIIYDLEKEISEKH